MKRFSRLGIMVSFAGGIWLAGSLRGESLDREFLAAVQAGDAAAVTRLLDEGADPSFRRTTSTAEFPETTALREAVTDRNADMMAAILERNPSDRVLADAILLLPGDREEKKSGFGVRFVETLLKQGKFPWLAENARILQAEAPVRRILQAGRVNDPTLVSKALASFDWETVEMAAESMPERTSKRLVVISNGRCFMPWF